MINIWTEKFKINSYHVDFQQRLKPSALMQFFQEAAGNHAKVLGAGYEQLIERKLFWALSRIAIKIEQMPIWGDEIEIETWPLSTEGLFFRRDFIIRTRQNAVAAKGVSAWLLVDSETMRPQRTSTLNLPMPDNSGKLALNYFPERITEATAKAIFSKKILYNEIDMNNHVNNTRYLDWVMDCFDTEQFTKYLLSSFTLEFLSETHWNDEIELQLGNKNQATYIQAVTLKNAKTVFKADVLWNNLKNH